MMESTHGRGSKSLAIGAVALLMAMSAFVMLSADDSDAAVTHNYYVSFSVNAGDSFNQSAEPAYKSGTTSTSGMPSWCTFTDSGAVHSVSGTVPADVSGVFVFTTTTQFRAGAQTAYKVTEWTITVNSQFSLAFNANGGTSSIASQSHTGPESTHTFTIPSEVPVRDGYTFAGWATSPSASPSYQPGSSVTMSPGSMTLYAIWNANWNVSDITVYAGQAISITPVASGTVSVSGVGWLSASGNCVFGTAPSENGVYDVTVSCGGSSASFKITVISALAFASIPSSGIFAYEG